MVVSMRKKLCYALAVILAGLLGLVVGMGYPDHAGILAWDTSPTVSETRLLSDHKNESPVRRVLGAQIGLFASRDFQEVEKRIEGLKALGVNTLIVRAFQNRGDRLFGFARPCYQTGVYFQTAHAPVVDAVLAKIVSIGHRHGFKVYAWMETRNMPLGLPDPEKSKARRYNVETGCLEPTTMWSIFDRTVEQRLIGLYQDVVGSGVDGILFQDDLVMYQYEDFSAKAAALFEKETGRDLDPEELFGSAFQDEQGRWLVSRYSDTFWLWARWKNQKLLELAHGLIRAARAVDPHMEIAMNFVYESVSDPRNALAWLSQSLTEAARLPIDYYSIMAYHRQMKKELQLTERAVYDRISNMTAMLLEGMADSHRILMKVQLSDWETRNRIPSFEANEIFQRINDQGRVSLAFFPYSPQLPGPVIKRYFQ